MKKYRLYCLCAMLIASHFSYSVEAQNIILHGKVTNHVTGETVPAVSVLIKNSDAGTYTDEKGNFRLVTNHALPLTLVISSIGFETTELAVNNSKDPLVISFMPSSSLGAEIVVSASRVPERILESPVSIERVNTAAIRNTPASSYYDIIRTLKGVDVTTASLTFSSPTTRGFNGSGNLRFNQLVDGMDNQAPGLNFSVGSAVGPTELDVDNMELLPGASSALYGSGGMNGTLLITSKDPFKYQGFSAQIKQGVMHLGKTGDPVKASPYFDWSFRWGKKVSEKFAFKVGAQFIQAKDWMANDTSNYTGAGTGSQNHSIPGTRASDPNYDGVNVYGDETSVDITNPNSNFLGGAAQQIIAANPALAPQVLGVLANEGSRPFAVSRTGYKESEVINNNTVSFKFSGGLYYKITSGLEASLTANWGTGNTVYTGSDRYSLKNMKIGQYKLEFKAANWFLRAYTTQENSGDAFNATINTQLFNEAWKPSYDPNNAAGSWFPQYAGAYLLARATSPATPEQANAIARAAADIGRPAAGSSQFNTTFNNVASKPIPIGGKFLDRSDLYQAEGQYNFSSVIHFAEIVAGANWRQYVLNSQGTLFADSAGVITTNEIGAYIQAARKLLDEKLKLTASIRYDKNDNFKGKFTPRFSAVYSVTSNHHIRASYQNAYRFPSNQNQWINLATGEGVLLGGLPQLRDYYHFSNNDIYTAASVKEFQDNGSNNPALLKLQGPFGEYKPESMNSFELGYKGLFGKRLLLDLYAYYSKYKDFIGRVSVVQLSQGRGFSVSVNSANRVNTYGAGLGVDYLLPQNFAIDFNLSSDRIDNPDPNFATYFNTPKYRLNAGLSNSGFGFQKRFGFNVQYRWQDAYYTEEDFKQGDVSAFGTIDGQINFKLPKTRSMIKLGATNILNKYYVTAYANPAIGGLYYVSFAYNVF